MAKSQQAGWRQQQAKRLKAYKAKKAQEAKKNKRHASGVSVAQWEARTKPRQMVSTPGVVNQKYTVTTRGNVLNEKGNVITKAERDKLGRTVGWREEVNPLTGAKNIVPAVERAQINRSPDQINGARLLTNKEIPPVRSNPTVATPENPIITKGEIPQIQTDIEKRLEDIAVKKAMGQPLTEEDLRTEFQAARQQPQGIIQPPQISPDPYMPPEFANLTAEQVSMLSPADQARYQQYADQAALLRQRDFQQQMGGQINNIYNERIGEAQQELNQAKEQITEENDQLLQDFKNLREQMDAEDIKAIKEAGAEGLTQIQNMMARRGFGRSSATAEQLRKASANTQARVAEIEAATGAAIKDYQVKLLDRLDQKLQKYEDRVAKYKDAKDEAKLKRAQDDLDLAQKIFEADPKNPQKVYELAQTLSQQRIADKEALQGEAVRKFEKALELGYLPTGMSKEEQLILADNLGVAPEDFGSTVVELINRAKTKAQMEKVHYAQDMFGNTTAVIPNFDTGKFDSVVVTQGPFGNMGITGGVAGTTTAGPGVYQNYGAISDDVLSDIFKCGEVGDWCGIYASKISDAGPVGNTWEEKAAHINKRVDLSDPSTYPTPGDKLLIPIGVKTDKGNGAREYGHVATVLDFDPTTNNIKVVHSNADGRQNKTNGREKGVITLGVYNVNELNALYSNVAGGWGLREGNFVPEIQQKLDAAYSTATPMMQPTGQTANGIDFATAYNEAVIRGAKDPMQTAAIWMMTGQLPPKTEEEIKAEEAAQKAEIFQEEHQKNVLNTIDDVLPMINDRSAGLVGVMLSNIPSSSYFPNPAYDLKVELDTIKSNLMLNELQAMKEASKTGASGMGQLSEKEGEVLRSALGSLDQGQRPEQLKKTLKTIRDSLSRWYAGGGADYMAKSGYTMTNLNEPAASNTTSVTEGTADDILAEYNIQ